MLYACLVSALRCLVVAACTIPGYPLAAEQRLSGLPVPDHTILVATAIAEGVQIYESRASKAGGYQWELKGPQAVLTTISGESFGRHDLGPTWTASDGSQVFGALMGKVDAPRHDAIPWLLLGVKSKTGSGILSDVD